jgi:hypothetical protein
MLHAVDPRHEWDDVFDQVVGLDPDTHGELFQAAVDRAMTLEIGLAAREHVYLDQVLHLTVFGLTGRKMSPGASTSTLITRIEQAITDRPLPGPAATDKAWEALSAARLANQHRNRVLHDQWMAVYDDEGPRLARVRTDRPGVLGHDISSTRETLSSIKSVSEELSTVWFRIFGIFLYAGLSEGVPESEVETECTRPLSLIAGPKTPTLPDLLFEDLTRRQPSRAESITVQKRSQGYLHVLHAINVFDRLEAVPAPL